MKILLRKWHGRLEAFIGQSQRTYLRAGPAPGGSELLSALNSPLTLILLAIALAVVWLMASGGISGELLTVPVFGMGRAAVAPSKNRQANEYRERARAKLTLIQGGKNADGTDITAEQFTAYKNEFDDLNARAQFLAEHTPEAEIERQGGEGDLVRLNGQENQEEGHRTLAEQVEDLRKKAIRAFGGISEYVRCSAGRKDMTAKQMAIVEQARELTRTIVGTTSDASGAEYLLPLEQEKSIFVVDNTIPGLLQRARLYSMRGRTKRIPYAIQTNEHLTRPLSGITNVQIIGEGSLKDTREPAFGQRVLTAFKYAAISEFSDEMLEDDMTGELDPTVTKLVGGEIMNQINYDITIAGGGTTAPVGALHTSANGALLKVTRANQNAISFVDAVNMYAAHTHGPNSFWVASRTALAELLQFELSSGSPLTFLMSLAQDPANARLLGYPIVISDFMNALGSEGDFGLINPDHYAAALRKQLTVESSIHEKFRYDITTYRFVARGGGINIPTAPYAYRSASSTNVNEHSPFVVLDDVYV